GGVAAHHEGADAAADQHDRADRDRDFHLLLAGVALERGELMFVRLLRGHRLHARAVLGFGASLLDLAVLDGLEARGLFLAALLFGAARFFLFAEAALFRFASCALGGGAGICFRAGARLLVGLFFLDAVFLKVHELLEREENRAFLLFGHVQIS